MALNALNRIAVRCGRTAKPRGLRLFQTSTSQVDDPMGIDSVYDKDYVVFPRNRTVKGIDYELNWSLCAKGVAPNINAFRNLDDKGLIMRSAGGLGASKELLAQDGSLELEATADADGVFSSVAEHLSNIVDVFVQDGALGSAGGDEEMRVRVVTDCPELALAVKNLLVAVPLAKDSREQGNSVTVFVATGLGGSGSAPYAAIDRSEDGSDVDVAVAGSPSFASLKSLLEQTAQNAMASRGLLALRCAAYQQGASSVLVFSDDASAPIAPLEGLTLYGAHSQVWGSGGISRVFSGALFDAAAATPSRGAVALGESGTVSSLGRADNVISHPTKAVFMSSRAKKGPADAATVRQWITAAGHSEEQAADFEQRVKEHGVAVFGATTAADALEVLA